MGNIIDDHEIIFRNISNFGNKGNFITNSISNMDYSINTSNTSNVGSVSNESSFSNEGNLTYKSSNKKETESYS